MPVFKELNVTMHRLKNLFLILYFFSFFVVLDFWNCSFGHVSRERNSGMHIMTIIFRINIIFGKICIEMGFHLIFLDLRKKYLNLVSSYFM